MREKKLLLAMDGLGNLGRGWKMGWGSELRSVRTCSVGDTRGDEMREGIAEFVAVGA